MEGTFYLRLWNLMKLNEETKTFDSVEQNLVWWILPNSYENAKIISLLGKENTDYIIDQNTSVMVSIWGTNWWIQIFIIAWEWSNIKFGTNFKTSRNFNSVSTYKVTRTYWVSLYVNDLETSIHIQLIKMKMHCKKKSADHVPHIKEQTFTWELKS